MAIEKTPAEYYRSEGYVVFRGLICHELIDKLLTNYREQILISRNYFFRQSSDRWQKNRISKYGYAEESFRDVHDYHDYPEFSAAALDIFCSDSMIAALTQLTGASSHNLMQSMLFDQNTATPAHQDSFYLDSLPNHNLLAAWIALEDINEKAGRFWVMPRSHTTEIELTDAERTENPLYLKKVGAYVAAHTDRVVAPALNKGDVLFWNSWTIHGSSPTLDPKFSRKSLTSHYLPSHMQFGDRHSEAPRDVEYFGFDAMKIRKVPEVHSRFSIRHKIYTDMMKFLWDRPLLHRTATQLLQMKRKILP